MYQAAIEEGACVWDLKRGDAPHKRIWATSARRTVQIHAVRRSARGAWVNFWQYGELMARISRTVDDGYRTLRRAGRVALTPLARYCPAVLPERLRQRLLEPPGQAGHHVK
jgi:hypothetical protein